MFEKGLVVNFANVADEPSVGILNIDRPSFGIHDVNVVIAVHGYAIGLLQTAAIASVLWSR
jgi:hypothetical protein